MLLLKFRHECKSTHGLYIQLMNFTPDPGISVLRLGESFYDLISLNETFKKTTLTLSAI
jgi:hypothetical protein